MELLKTMLLILSMAVLSPLQAQQAGELENAFKSSYALETEGDYAGAIKLLKGFYDEDSYELNLRLGWLHYLSGLFTESVPYYKRCIALKPLSVEARLGLVYPVSAMGNWTQVEKTYLEILGIDPQNSAVNYRMGLIFYGREEYEEAFRYFEKVVNHYPFDYDSVIMLAWTNFQLGKMREAKVLFRKALLSRPGDESALSGLELTN